LASNGVNQLDHGPFSKPKRLQGSFISFVMPFLSLNKPVFRISNLF
jgi:hypothetical protein